MQKCSLCVHTYERVNASCGVCSPQVLSSGPDHKDLSFGHSLCSTPVSCSLVFLHCFTGPLSLRHTALLGACLELQNFKVRHLFSRNGSRVWSPAGVRVGWTLRSYLVVQFLLISNAQNQNFPPLRRQNHTLLRATLDPPLCVGTTCSSAVPGCVRVCVGMEAAAYLADHAASLTCLDILDTPFKLVLGDQIGLALKKVRIHWETARDIECLCCSVRAKSCAKSRRSRSAKSAKYETPMTGSEKLSSSSKKQGNGDSCCGSILYRCNACFLCQNFRITTNKRRWKAQLIFLWFSVTDARREGHKVHREELSGGVCREGRETHGGRAAGRDETPRRHLHHGHR